MGEGTFSGSALVTVQCIEDVKRCLANGDLASFVESMGISTDDVWTGVFFKRSKQSKPHGQASHVCLKAASCFSSVLNGSLDEKLPSYGVFKTRENSREGKSRVD